MRKYINLNENWGFIKENLPLEALSAATKQAVTLPHTWNNLDGQDGGGDYIRDAFWYTRELTINKEADTLYYLDFSGVSYLAEVFVNEIFAGNHNGGFSTFRLNITDLLADGENTICVKADNRENETTYPQTADFTFFGGIYRDVTLIEVNKTHFDLEYYGGSGFQVTPVLQSNKKAEITLEAFPVNADGCSISYTITDQNNTVCAVIEPDEGITAVVFTMEHPHLWNGTSDPYLYTATAGLIKEGVIVDQVATRFGVRSFSVDPKKGFFLNGRPYPLHGVSRHQDREDMGWAITKKEHKEDIELIKEVGANTIRLAHYQHDSYFYDLCDEYGMVIWAEIPFISIFITTPEAHENTISQMKELVIQNYNHPSICFWGISNEITIGDAEDPALAANLQELNDLTHTLDKTRLTTMANVSMLEPESGLSDIVDVIAYNHYFGWYMGEVGENAEWIDKFHEDYPKRSLAISEYGAEGILKWHTDDPKVRDYTEEYHAYYHESMLKIFSARPFLWATYVWNMFDFGADNRDEGGVKGRNNKGLVTYDRSTKKDAYFAYQAYWKKDPMLHICGIRYAERASESISLKVYSNCQTITLSVNGSVIEQKAGDKVYQFDQVPLIMGENTITATCNGIEDTIVLTRVSEPNQSYSLPQDDFCGADGENVANWFATAQPGSTLEKPEGYFSIFDTLKDLMSVPEGEAFAATIFEKMAGNSGMKANKGMLKMVSGMPLNTLLKLAGKNMSQDNLLSINQALNKIKK